MLPVLLTTIALVDDKYRCAKCAAHDSFFALDSTACATKRRSGCTAGGQGRLGHGSESNEVVPRLIAHLEQVVAVAAGNYHSMALSAEGHVFTWGYDRDGRLGHGDEGHRAMPELIEALQAVKVVGVTASSDHSLAVSDEGRVYSWGFGFHGRLGHGNNQHQLTPKVIEALQDVKVVKVAAGTTHSLAATEAGRASVCARAGAIRPITVPRCDDGAVHDAGARATARSPRMQVVAWRPVRRTRIARRILIGAPTP